MKIIKNLKVDYSMFSLGVMLNKNRDNALALYPALIQSTCNSRLTASPPPSLTFRNLREPHSSVPANPLLAQSLYLAGYIEQMGTGTLDMMKRCADAGLAEPEFSASDGFVAKIWRKVSTGQVTGQVTDDIMRLLAAFRGDHTRRELQEALNINSCTHFEGHDLKPAIQSGYVVLALPDKPTSRLQEYRLTDKGRGVLETLKSENASG